MVHCCRLSRHPQWAIQGGPRHTGLLRHHLHRLRLYLHRRPHLPPPSRDWRRARRTQNPQDPHHLPVLQPVVNVHRPLLVGGLLPHQGLLRLHHYFWQIPNGSNRFLMDSSDGFPKVLMDCIFIRIMTVLVDFKTFQWIPNCSVRFLKVLTGS